MSSKSRGNYSIRLCMKAWACPVKSEENCADCRFYSKLKEYEWEQEKIRKGISK